MLNNMLLIDLVFDILLAFIVQIYNIFIIEFAIKLRSERQYNLPLSPSVLALTYYAERVTIVDIPLINTH